MRLNAVTIAYNTNIVSKYAFAEHVELYNNYVKKSNEILRSLSENADRENADKNYSICRGLKKELSYNLDGVILHELLFRIMGKGEAEPNGAFIKLCRESFNSFDAWEQDLKATAKSSRGWAIACYEQRTGSLQNILLDSHSNGLVAGMYPLVIIDTYEHAYAPDFGSDNESYISRCIQNINWISVNERMAVLNDK